MGHKRDLYEFTFHYMRVRELRQWQLSLFFMILSENFVIFMGYLT